MPHRVTDIAGEVDLAVVAVPAARSRRVADCGAAGVRGLVVVSSGFAETGAEGAARQDDLVRTAHPRHAGRRAELVRHREHRPGRSG